MSKAISQNRTCATSREEPMRVLLDQDDLGSVSEKNLEEAEGLLLDVVARAENATIELVLQAEFVGAAFVGLIAEINALLRVRGCELKIVDASSWARELFGVCGMSSLLD